MYIIVTGLRGIPGLQGGVEKHCEQLYPIIAKNGCKIEICGRSPFLDRKVSTFKGAKIRRLYAPDPKYKGVEAFVNTLVATVYAAFKRPDVLHIHAVGPALFTPLAKLFGLRVVVTHHGFDYGREKWGSIARLVLETGEWFGMKFADKRIVISKSIQKHVKNRYHVDSIRIPNGVAINPPPFTSDTLDLYHLDKDRYFLMVSRFVPEKRQDDLIKAFLSSKMNGWKLVLVGDITFKDEYIKKIEKLAHKSKDIILTGFLTGRPLEELYAHAGCFVLPSSHEGLPIVILEALSYGVPVLASNIEANVEVGLDENNYFKLGNINELSSKMVDITQKDIKSTNQKELINHARKYSWAVIAKKTFDVYQNCLS